MEFNYDTGKYIFYVLNESINAQNMTHFNFLIYSTEPNEIKYITNNNSIGPNREWLNIVKTTQARNKIKNFFNKQDKDENIKNGEVILNKELKKRKISNAVFEENIDKILSKIKLGSLTEIYSNLGSGKLNIDSVFDAIYKEEVSKEEKMLEKAEKLGMNVTDKKSAVTVDGMSDIKVNIASCCNPVYGDRITGYITKGSGVSVHRTMCPNISNINERLINVSWNETDDKYLTNIIIYFDFDKDVLLNVVTKATSDKIGVLNVLTTKNSNGNSIEMSVLVKNKTELIKFMNDIRMINGISNVERLIK